jgi:hypothetical protein
MLVAVDVEETRERALDGAQALGGGMSAVTADLSRALHRGLVGVVGAGERIHAEALVLGEDLAVERGTVHRDDEAPGGAHDARRRAHDRHDGPVLLEETADGADRIVREAQELRDRAEHRRGAWSGRGGRVAMRPRNGAFGRRSRRGNHARSVSARRDQRSRLSGKLRHRLGPLDPLDPHDGSGHDEAHCARVCAHDVQSEGRVPQPF